MGTQDDWIRQTVRLPPGTHDALKALASKNNRSVNAQLLEIVQTWVEGETARGPEKASGDESAVIDAIRRLSPERQEALLTLIRPNTRAPSETGAVSPT